MCEQSKKQPFEHLEAEVSHQTPELPDDISLAGSLFLVDDSETAGGPVTQEGWAEHLPAEHRDVAKQLRRKHGASFLLYLEHHYQYGAADIEEDFYSTYIGSYDSLFDWVMESYQELGWVEAVERMMHEHNIPEGALEWSVDYFIHWAKKYQRFQIHSFGGQFHVFQP